MPCDTLRNNETMQLIETFLFLAVSNALRNSGNNETIQHGACLGIGLAGMATGNEELYEDCEFRDRPIPHKLLTQFGSDHQRPPDSS